MAVQTKQGVTGSGDRGVDRLTVGGGVFKGEFAQNSRYWGRVGIPERVRTAWIKIVVRPLARLEVILHHGFRDTGSGLVEFGDFACIDRPAQRADILLRLRDGFRAGDGDRPFGDAPI